MTGALLPLSMGCVQDVALDHPRERDLDLFRALLEDIPEGDHVGEMIAYRCVASRVPRLSGTCDGGCVLGVCVCVCVCVCLGGGSVFIDFVLPPRLAASECLGRSLCVVNGAEAMDLLTHSERICEDFGKVHFFFDVCVCACVWHW